jgi:hypothetical protein
MKIPAYLELIGFIAETILKPKLLHAREYARVQAQDAPEKIGQQGRKR